MKIFCIGRNYIAHAKELNNKVPKQPLVFIKPDTALCNSNEIPYPEFSNNLQYELEVVLHICKTGKAMSIDEAASFYDKIGLGIDYTARDIQSQCKEKGHSWEKAKAFDNSASISPLFSKSNYNLASINFNLDLNETTVQVGNTKDLIFNFDYLIKHISQYFTLTEGDLIMTGTPAGVGPVKNGDILKCYLEDELILENSINCK